MARIPYPYQLSRPMTEERRQEIKAAQNAITGPYNKNGNPQIQFYYLSDHTYELQESEFVQHEFFKLLSLLIDGDGGINNDTMHFMHKTLINCNILVYDEKFEGNKDIQYHRYQILKNYQLKLDKIKDTNGKLLSFCYDHFIKSLLDSNFKSSYYFVLFCNTMIHRGILQRIDAAQQLVDKEDFI